MPGGGQKIFNQELETSLNAFVEKIRAEKKMVSYKMISREATRIWRQIKERNSELPEFKSSCGYVQNFCKRNGFVLRRRTTVAQKPPSDYLEKIISFIRYTRSLRHKESYTMSDIIGCDETPVWFEAVSNTSLDKAGAKEVSVLSTGHEKMRCTVMLSAKADGTKLKPFVIFKRKRHLPDLERKHPNVVIGYTDNGWFNEETTKEYLDKVAGK